VVDRVLTEAEADQLASGHDPVLCCRQPADGLVDGI
jgi:hypothetical protein